MPQGDSMPLPTRDCKMRKLSVPKYRIHLQKRLPCKLLRLWSCCQRVTERTKPSLQTILTIIWAELHLQNNRVTRAALVWSRKVEYANNRRVGSKTTSKNFFVSNCSRKGGGRFLSCCYTAHIGNKIEQQNTTVFDRPVHCQKYTFQNKLEWKYEASVLSVTNTSLSKLVVARLLE